MRNQRQSYADLIRQEGLSKPDEKVMEYLRLIVDEGALGASKHVVLIQELFMHIIESEDNSQQLPQKLKLTGEFIANTRGADTPYIANSIHWMLRDADQASSYQVGNVVNDRIKQWDASSRKRRERLLEVALSTLRNKPRLVLFDYSSTVSEITRAALKEGCCSDIVVFESRAISGGKPYLEELLQDSTSIHYLPDAAFEYALADANAVLFGVESLRCDGSFLNTLGSKPLSRIAQQIGVPVYACTDLFKLDLQSYQGKLKEPSLRHFDSILPTTIKDHEEKVHTKGPELEVIPARLTTALITEHGPLPPSAVWNLGRELFPEVKAYTA